MKRNTVFLAILAAVAIGAVVFVWWNEGVDTNTDESAQTHTSGANVTESWMRYENEAYGFSFAYPNDWYLNDDEGEYALVSVTPMSPDDPRNASSVGLGSVLVVGLLQEQSIEAHIRNITESPYNTDVTSSEIAFDNGTAIPFISYGTPYGANMNEAFITLSDGTILNIWFSSRGDVYLDTLRSFEW